MARAGLSAIERDLETEIEEKRQEIRQMRRVVTALSKLAQAEESAFPVEIAYDYTASRSNDEFVTKTEELEIDSPDAAETAARKLENKLERLGRLRDQMVEELQRQQHVVAETKARVGDFVDGTRPLIREVLAVLH